MTVYGEQLSPADLVPVQADAVKIELLEKRTAAEALATLPGVTLTRVGARNETSVFVRGFSRTQTPIFIDGVPAYVPYDGYVDLARFTTYDLATISVAKGYSSVLYGANTMGGAINLVSRQPASEFEGQVAAGLFSGEGVETSLNVGTKQKRWYAQGGASYVDRETFPLSDHFPPVKAEDGGDRENAYSTDTKYSGKIGFTPNATDEYALGFVHQEGQKGNPPYTGPIASMLRYWRWPEWNKQTVYFVSHTELDEAFYIKPRLYYDRYDNALDQYSDKTYSTLLSGASGPSAYHDYSYGGSVESGLRLLPGHEPKAALHWKLDHHDEQVLSQPHYLFEDRTVSAALEDTWRPSRSWTVQAGLDYDRRETLRADQVNPDNTPVALTTFDSFNPAIALFRLLGDSGSLRASFARKSRFPNIKDRYSYRFNTAFPNAGLRPENALHYEIGYDGHLTSALTLSASAYLSRIGDAIQTVNNVNGTTRTQNQNVGTVRNRGIDVGVEHTTSSWLRLGASYTYLDQENRTNPAAKVTDTPRHSGNVYADLRPLRWLSVVPTYEFASWRYADTSGRRLSGFATAGLKLTARLPHGLTLSGGAGNVFDKNYQLQDGFPEAGRNWFANVRYTF